MIDFETAERIVLERLALWEREMNDRRASSAVPSGHLVVTGSREYEFGWVFFYNSKEFVESGNVRQALLGNAPFIVDKNVGRLYVTGTACPVEVYIDEYRRGIRHPAPEPDPK